MKLEELMEEEDSEPEESCSELAGTHFTIGKKIPMKIPEFKRSGIELIAEFRRIPNGFPNQVIRIQGVSYSGHPDPLCELSLAR
jgi:hypothetical protein